MLANWKVGNVMGDKFSEHKWTHNGFFTERGRRRSQFLSFYKETVPGNDDYTLVYFCFFFVFSASNKYNTGIGHKKYIALRRRKKPFLVWESRFSATILSLAALKMLSIYCLLSRLPKKKNITG